jgi:uncharacterized repeat protein (TIGR02543 family)
MMKNKRNLNIMKNIKKHMGIAALTVLFTLALSFLPGLAAPVAAATDPFDGLSVMETVHTEAALNSAITTAGTTPTWIKLGTDFQSGSLVNLTHTVTIPANAVIKISGGTLQGPRDEGNKFRILSVVANAYLEIEDVVVTGGWAPSDWSYYNAGGGVGVAGEFVMKSGRITANTGGRGGGVTVVGNSARFTLYDGKIDNNLSPSSSGGGVLVENAALFTMKGGKIADNTASSGGGVFLSAMSANGATFVMEGGEISGNSVPNLGGGVYVYWNTHFSMNAGLIADNTAYRGGGVYSDLLYAVIQNSYTPGNFHDLHIGPDAVFSGNTAGALYKMTNDHEGLYAEVVDPGAVFSFPEEALSSPPKAARLTGFNDFDIGYMQGNPIYYPPVYTISFAPNGGTGQMAPVLVGASASTGYQTPYTYPLPPNTFTRSGYSFSGWLADDVTSTPYADEATVENIDQDIILTAQWLPVPPPEYTVSFEAGGGTGSMASASVTEGDDYILPPNAFTRSGYAFSGWLANDVANTPYADEATIENIDQNIILTAQWRYIDSGGGGSDPPEPPPPVVRTYTVSFAAGGGTGAMAAAKVTEGKDYTLPPNAFTRMGYTFNGWLANDAENTVYAAEAVIGPVVRDIQLTAQWRPEITEHTVSFAAGGGTGAMASVKVADGADYTLPPNAFTRTDYAFNGWLANDAEHTEYADGAVIGYIVQDIQLTALWRVTDEDTSAETPVEPSEPPSPPAEPEESLEPDLPPDGNNLIPGDDGVYLEVDETGVPQGVWHWDEAAQAWVFEPSQPLEDLPKTGGSEPLPWPLLTAAFTAGAFSLRVAAGQRRAVASKE